MKRTGSYIIPLFFLLLTLAPILFMGGLQAFQFYIKQRMEASLERDALQTIMLPAHEVIWYEEGKEILVDGKMFDIKTYTIANGIFTAQGIVDEEETKVVNLLNGHWSDKEQTHFVVQLLMLSHCIILFAFYLFSFGMTGYRCRPVTLISLIYHAPHLAILIPPPKVVKLYF